MKGRRRHRERKRISDPVEQVMEQALKTGHFMPFYCGKHGKHFFNTGVRPVCPTCGSECFTSDEWEYQNSAQKRRERRERQVQLLRNNLE